MKIDNEIRSFGKENKVPITLDDTLSFLIQTINENQCKEILEIGTAIGFGCISIAENTECNHVDTLEIDEERFNIADVNINNKGLENRISTHLIDAKEYLTNCKKKYDFIYLDGPKGQYINYLPLLVKILNPNGIIFADNLNFHGMVTGEIPVTRGCRAMIKGLKNYIVEVTTNPLYETKLYKEIGDGVGITKLKEKSA